MDISVPSASPDPLFGADGQLSIAALQQRNWRLERACGHVLAPRLILHPGGRMGLHRHRDQWCWSVKDGRLTFGDWHGRSSTIFEHADRDDQGRAILSGTCRYDELQHRLIEIEPIGVIDPGEDAPALLGRNGGRRNLVVVRGNENSLHPRWPANVTDSERSWDLCVSFYGKPGNFPPGDFAEFHVLQNEDGKYRAIHKLFHQGSPLWNYDHIMLADDDVMASWLDLNNLFETCREYRLEIAQPALTTDSFWGQQVTVQQPDTLLRYTNYVEGMVPVFSAEALRLCVATFQYGHVGWGLDAIWPAMIGSHVNRVAIIDLIGVRHTRPVGTSYRGHDAAGEAAETMRFFGVSHQLKEYGRLLLV